RLFALHASLALAALFVAGLYWPALGALIITVYFVWSPWHFAGQNYGLSLMFLRRGGVSVPLPPRRWLYAAYWLSFAIALLVFQMQSSSASFAPEFVADGRGYRVLSLGIPRAITAPLVALCLAAFLGALALSARGFLRAGARWGDLLAPALLA